MALLRTRAPGGDESKLAIAKLTAESRALAAEKTKLSKRLRNEARNRNRILDKSARLSTMDLVEVSSIRQEVAISKSSSG